MTEPPGPPQSPVPDNSTPSAGTPPPQPFPGGYAAYPPSAYPPSAYPPSAYPPSPYPPSAYPPHEYLPPGTYPPPGIYPPPPYPGYAAPLPAAPRNGLATGAIIASVLSLPAAFTVFGGFILAIAGIILGVMGYNRARRGEATNPGVAVASIVLGVLGIILSAALIALGVWGFLKVGGGDYVECIRQAGSDTAAKIQCEEQFKDSLNERLSVTPTPPR